MSDVLAVARNDFRSVRRSRLLWGVVAIYVGLTVILFYPAGGEGEITVPYTLLGATWLTTLLLPLVAITGSYLAIAGERESNTVRFLLSQPTARRSVVLGKFLSRGVTLTLGLLVAVGVGVALVLAFYPASEPALLATFFGLSSLLVSAYVAVSIGVSAAVASRARAIAATIGFYFVTVVLSVLPWFSIEGALRRLLGDVLGLRIAADLYTLVAALLSPAVAYFNALFNSLPADAAGDVPADVPVYLEPWFLAVVLVLWIAVPLALGSVAFDRTEIG